MAFRLGQEIKKTVKDVRIKLCVKRGLTVFLLTSFARARQTYSSYIE